MKTLIKIFTAFTVVICSINMAVAQSSRAERKAAKIAEVKKMIDSGSYIFEANLAYPQRGGTRELTSDYDLQVSKDTIKSYLPYFGRAYIAPVDPTEGGIKFTSTSFNYSVKQKKNGNWEVLIKPKEHDMADMKDVQQLMLTISVNGYASLQVISTNRDPILFDGEIIGKTKGKN